MDNMHNAELYGRVLTVNIAKPQSIKLGYQRPVWAEADVFYSKLKESGADTERATKTATVSSREQAS